MSKVKHDLKIEGSKLVITVSVDPNEDGQAVLKNTTEVDILEIPDEVMAVISAKKTEAKA